MASSGARAGRTLWIIALCTAAVVGSLAVHLTADVAGAPPELAARLAHGRSANDEHTTTCDLLEEIALLAIATAINLLLLGCLINSFNLALLDWVLPPPVRPPIVICRFGYDGTLARRPCQCCFQALA